MSKNLVIVESPAKAKTIEKFLGKDFTVKSCFGHIRDLAKGDKAIDKEDGFKPKYEVPADKKSLVKELKSISDKSDTVWLASDEDREGEAISWHLSEVLELDASKRKRIVFHEITKPAILKAIESPRDIDQNLVDAQQARRILDRLVGFELSPILWRKIKPSLSAGRVQSVAVRLIVEKERDIENFQSVFTYKVYADFSSDGKSFRAELKTKFKSKEEALEFMESCIGANFKAQSITVKPTTRKPSPPFTTSTLQQEASRKLGYGVSRTMMLAQRLYENGHITYMRTDSVNLSELAVGAAKEEITSKYGEEFSNPRQYSNKTKGAQEAHEAIRPTYFNKSDCGADDAQMRLYNLIWKRAISSQMSEARLEKTNVQIASDQSQHIFGANGEVITFEGFLKVYIEGKDDDDSDEDAGRLPKIVEGQELEAKDINAVQKFSRPPYRYTEASLVKKMEELGIGRPSTYAPTITTIQKREYVDKGEVEGKERKFDKIIIENNAVKLLERTEIAGADRNKLIPTDIGKVVNDFLIEHFDEILDFQFTASVEKEFDKIAKGLQDWTEMIDGFYSPFHVTVNKTLETAEKATGERELGVDPKSGKKVFARIGRFGAMVQLGERAETDEDEKPKFASLRKGQSIDKITFDEALELFKLPRIAGMFEEMEMKVAIGRFGPYVQHNKKFVSLGKEDDPMTVTADRAIELILAKRKTDAERLIQVFEGEDEIQILNGRWGPYITYKKKNYKIPKDQDPKELNLEQVMELIKNPPPKKVKKDKKKKKA
jgi:DNA topoisomerase I